MTTKLSLHYDNFLFGYNEVFIFYIKLNLFWYVIWMSSLHYGYWVFNWWLDEFVVEMIGWWIGQRNYIRIFFLKKRNFVFGASNLQYVCNINSLQINYKRIKSQMNYKQLAL